jgi:hypothetical protein
MVKENLAAFSIACGMLDNGSNTTLHRETGVWMSAAFVLALVVALRTNTFIVQDQVSAGARLARSFLRAIWNV